MGVAEKYRGPTGNILPGSPFSWEEIRERLRALFERMDRVVLAYVFGSYARGEARELSDVDVAVLVDAESPQELATLDRDVYLAVRDALGSERFDLVLLNRAPLSLKFEIVAHGDVVYARDDDTLNQFEMDILRRYQDAAYLRRVQEMYLNERIKSWYSKDKVS